MGGHRAWVEPSGAGPTLLWLSNIFLRNRTARRTRALLAQRFAVLAVELPGGGRADRVATPWPLERYADWTARLIATLGLERPWVLGHSHTGGVALLLGARHPGRVGGLVLADPIGGLVDKSLSRMVLGRARDGWHESQLNLTSLPDLAGNLGRHGRNFVHQARASIQADLRSEAAAIDAPTLLAWGRHDHTFPLDCAERLRDRIAGSRLYVSARGSHDWCLVRPEEFAGAVVQFADLHAGRTLVASGGAGTGGATVSAGRS